MATAIGSYATTALFKELAGITASDDDTLIGKTCDRANQYMETQMGQVVAPISSATYLYDGNGLTHIPLAMPIDAIRGIGGLRVVTLVESAPQSGGTFATIAATDYVLRGPAKGGGPFRYLVLSDHPVGTVHSWPSGRGTLRITGTAGWTAIPDDLTNLALGVVQRWWNVRQSGYQNVDGVDETGKPIIARFFALPDYQTLKAYTIRQPQVFG